MESLQVGTAALPSRLAPDKLERVLDFIGEHLAEPLPVQQLARVANLSTFHFARLFKEATGRTPHAYITHLRMEQAKQLLGESELPLRQVATVVGYQTQAHFTGVFHRHVGATPRVFRMTWRVQRPNA